MSLLTIFQNRKRVLGQNERNLVYIRDFNSERAIEIADNKILTKKILTAAEIPSPALLAVIKSKQELKTFNWDDFEKSFVIKPVTGYEGRGIDIFYNRDQEGKWIRANRTKVSKDELYRLIERILEGEYSIDREPDFVMIEERIKSHKNFKYYTYKGTPDIRVLVFNKIPVMSYIRIPTEESEGKANLALGALGVGIDLASGRTTSAIHGKSGEIEYVPNTKLHLRGLRIPYWDKILRYAIQAQEATNLGFAAIDFLIDRDKGPMIVELNARPGLSIQLANEDGLRWRLKKAGGIKVKTIDKGIRLAKDLFGGEIEEEIEVISGRDVIGIYENIKIMSDNGKEVETIAKIDTGADSTSIDREIAIKLGFTDILEALDAKQLPSDISREAGLELEKKLTAELKPKFENLVEVQFVRSSHGNSIRPYVKIQLKIKDTVFETNANIYDRSHLNYSIIVGRKSLTKFLVDPSK